MMSTFLALLTATAAAHNPNFGWRLKMINPVYTQSSCYADDAYSEVATIEEARALVLAGKAAGHNVHVYGRDESITEGYIGRRGTTYEAIQFGFSEGEEGHVVFNPIHPEANPLPEKDAYGVLTCDIWKQFMSTRWTWDAEHKYR